MTPPDRLSVGLFSIVISKKDWKLRCQAPIELLLRLTYIPLNILLFNPIFDWSWLTKFATSALHLKGLRRIKIKIYIFLSQPWPQLDQCWFFCKLLLNGGSHDTCIQFLWSGAKEYKFSFSLCAGPFRLNI